MESKRISLPEIENIVKASRESIHQHEVVISNMNKFADNFILMVKAECPEFSEKTKQIAALIKGAMDQEQVISDAEQRLAEDLNDLSVRYDVLVKFGNEIQAKRNAIDAQRKKILDTERAIDVDKLKGGLKVPKLQGDLTIAQKKKEELTEQLKGMLEEFIVMREKYATFKIRRLEHGYRNLGQVIVTALEVEKHLIGQLQRDCEQARDNLEDFFLTTEEIVQPLADDDEAPAEEQNEEE